MRNCNKCINYQEVKQLKDILLTILARLVGFIIGIFILIYVWSFV